MLFEIIICFRGCFLDYENFKDRTFETYESCVEAMLTQYPWLRQKADNPKVWESIAPDTGKVSGIMGCREVQPKQPSPPDGH